MGLQEPANVVGSSGEVPKAVSVSWLLFSLAALGSETAELFIPGASRGILGRLLSVSFSGMPSALRSSCFMAFWTHSSFGSVQTNLFLMVLKMMACLLQDG